MSPEMLTTVISGATLLLTLGGSTIAGFVWVIQRMDTMNAQLRTDLTMEIRGVRTDLTDQMTINRGELTVVRHELTNHIAALRSELTEQISTVRSELTEQISTVRSELTDIRNDVVDIKITVARWEGPLPRHGFEQHSEA